MTLFENVGFGLRVRPRRCARPEARFGEVNELLTLVQLDDLGEPLPVAALRRPAPARRAGPRLAASPKVLLLDEPFGALDAKVRQELRHWLRRLHEEIHVTSVFVTHDQEEAFEVADRVVVMNQGRIEQVGTPDEVFEHPATPFVMDFPRQRQRLPRPRPGRQGAARPAGDRVSGSSPRRGRDAAGYARPHELDVTRTEDGGGLWTTVTDVRATGAVVKIEVIDAENRPIQVELGREHYETLRAQVGERVYVKPRKVRVFMSNEIHAK